MLICAVWQVLQHADVCYNLPGGLWMLYSAKRRKSTADTPDSQCVQVHVWYMVWWMEKMLRHQIGSGNKISSGVLLIPLPQNRDTSAHTSSLHSPSTLCIHTCAASSCKYSWLSWIPWKSICPTTTILPGIASNSQFPALTPHSKRERPNHRLGRPSHPYNRSSHTAAPYLLDASALCAHEDQRVVLVDVGDDRGHFVESVGIERLAAHHLRHPQRCVHVEAAKVVINGQELR